MWKSPRLKFEDRLQISVLARRLGVESILRFLSKGLKSRYPQLPVHELWIAVLHGCKFLMHGAHLGTQSSSSTSQL